jgi:hypothetical protein
VHPLLQWRDPALSGPDLADDPRSDAGAVEAIANLADQLRGDVVHGAPRQRFAVGIERLEVPPTPGDEGDAGPFREPP